MARAKYQVIEFSVVGHGTFPYDMLRYDMAYPANEAESALLECPWCGGKEGAGHRMIRLKSHSYDGNNVKAPTEGRWKSFGWKVVEEQQYGAD